MTTSPSDTASRKQGSNSSGRRSGNIKNKSDSVRVSTSSAPGRKRPGSLVILKDMEVDIGDARDAENVLRHTQQLLKRPDSPPVTTNTTSTTNKNNNSNNNHNNNNNNNSNNSNNNNDNKQQQQSTTSTTTTAMVSSSSSSSDVEMGTSEHTLNDTSTLSTASEVVPRRETLESGYSHGGVAVTGSALAGGDRGGGERSGNLPQHKFSVDLQLLQSLIEDDKNTGGRRVGNRRESQNSSRSHNSRGSFLMMLRGVAGRRSTAARSSLGPTSNPQAATPSQQQQQPTGREGSFVSGREGSFVAVAGGERNGSVNGSVKAGGKRSFGRVRGFGRSSFDSSGDSTRGGGSFRSGSSAWTWGSSSFKGSWRGQKGFNQSQESLGGQKGTDTDTDTDTTNDGGELDPTQVLKQAQSLHRANTSWFGKFFSSDGEQKGTGRNNGRGHGFRKSKSNLSKQQQQQQNAQHQQGHNAPIQTPQQLARANAIRDHQLHAQSKEAGTTQLQSMIVDPDSLDVISVLGMGAFGTVFLVRAKINPFRKGTATSMSSGDMPKALSRKSTKKTNRHRSGKRFLVSTLSRGKRPSNGMSNAAHKTGAGTRVLALKVVPKMKLTDENARVNAATEIQVFREITNSKVCCPFFVHMYDSFQTRDRLFLLCDYAPGGELFFHLQRDRVFTVARARLYFIEIALALGHLHACDIVYRDLKSENILLDAQGHVKLTDFGLCKRLPFGHRARTLCGTPHYAAPEAIRGEGYNKEVDWWALGVLLFEMLVGGAPFHHPDLQTVYHQILYSPIMIPFRVEDREARSMIERLLARMPDERLGYGHGTAGGDIVAIQLHPFIRNHLNMEDVLALRIQPEFVPTLSGDVDTSHFDEEFTGMPTSVVAQQGGFGMSQTSPAPGHMSGGGDEQLRGVSDAMETDVVRPPVVFGKGGSEQLGGSNETVRQDGDGATNQNGFVRWVKAEPAWLSGHAAAG